MLLVKRKEQKDEKKLQLKTFRKNIIQLLIFLGIIIVFGFEYCN